MKLTLEELAQESPGFKISFDKLKTRLDRSDSLKNLAKIDREVLNVYLKRMTEVFETKEVLGESDICSYLFSYIMARASIDEIRLYQDILSQDISTGKKIKSEWDLCSYALSSLKDDVDAYAGSLGDLLNKTKEEIDQKEGLGTGNRLNLNSYTDIINSVYNNGIKPLYSDEKVAGLLEEARKIKSRDSTVLKKEDMVLLYFSEDVEKLVTGCRTAIEKAKQHKGIDFYKETNGPEEESMDQLYEAKSGIQQLFKGSDGINEATIAERFNGSDETELKSFERKTVEQFFVMAKFLMYAIREKYNEEFRQTNMLP